MLPPSISTHHHCRDEGESYKTTIPEQMAYAKSHNRVAIIDMPNNEPRTLTKADVYARNEIAEKNGCKKGYYINIGGTKDEKQLAEAVDAVETIDNVTGIKVFTTGADNDPIVLKRDEDLDAFHRILKNLGYEGVVIYHCEDENLFNRGSFDFRVPATWNKQRPKEAEVSAVKKVNNSGRKVDIDFGQHIAHVTCGEVIDVIVENSDYVDISFEITPQHMTLSTRDMQTINDLDKKMNPPIRAQEDVDRLWIRTKEEAKRRIIPIMSGTDNAPHTLDEKMKGIIHPDGRIDGYLSGCQGELYYPRFVHELGAHDFSPDDIYNILYGNAKKRFPKIKE
jgi:dihydroorotase